MAHDHDDPEHGQHPPSDMALRVKALETLLTQKGLIDPAALDAIVDTYEHKVGPKNGARVVARAWSDPAFKARLLADGTAGIGELGFGGAEGYQLVVVENTPDVHNLVVCTLCSCYPWPVLGLPPNWYKSNEYRARAVVDPRGVLRDFGVELPAQTEVRVWDSTAEVRYLVLPRRPTDADGLTEDALAERVTRDAMIGAGL
jgi:nitrile hydratase subunit alpha